MLSRSAWGWEDWWCWGHTKTITRSRSSRTTRLRRRRVRAAQTQGAADRALAAWIHAAEASDIRPFVRTARTLRRWRTEILTYWRYPITNAVVEGKHNRVKVLKRRAYGYRNDRTFSLGSST
ncbi:MAG: transposase [Chloroflexota bacterium]|nr:transposase [Chloroflexota bacterium]